MSDIAINITEDADSFFRSVYLAIGANAPVIDDMNVPLSFGESLFSRKEDNVGKMDLMKQAVQGLREHAFKLILELLRKIDASDQEDSSLFNEYVQLIGPQITKLSAQPTEANNEVVKELTCGNAAELKTKVAHIIEIFLINNSIWVDGNDIFEFEKNYNATNDKNQIKILKQNGENNELMELFKNDKGDAFFPSGDPIFFILRVQGGINYKLIVTKPARKYCAKYAIKQGSAGLCALPANYKNALTSYLTTLKPSNATETEKLRKFANHVQNGSPITPTIFATKEELAEEIGSSTASVSDERESVSNFSDESAHKEGLTFASLIGMTSFTDSLKAKMLTVPPPAPVPGTICNDSDLKRALENKTLNPTGLLGGKSRPSKKRRSSKLTIKRTKKRRNAR